LGETQWGRWSFCVWIALLDYWRIIRDYNTWVIFRYIQWRKFDLFFTCNSWQVFVLWLIIWSWKNFFRSYFSQWYLFLNLKTL